MTLLRDGRPVAEFWPVIVGMPLSELPALLASLPWLTADEADMSAKDLQDVQA